MTLAGFLAWEALQPVKYEFDGVHLVAMTGVSHEHSTIQINLTSALRERLRGTPCRVHGSDLKIEVAGSIRYPDAFVACGPIERGTLVIREPVVVFEIISPLTSLTDRIEKNQEYPATPSIQRYVLLEQETMAATVYTRAGDAWVAEIVAGERDVAMPEISAMVPLAEIYDGVAFPERAAGGTGLS
jgi:Uma2 family endonuclease